MEIKLNTRGGFEVDGLKLTPGYNKVEASAWEKTQAHPLVQAYLEQELIEVTADPKPRKVVGTPASLRGIALIEAKALISECDDRAQLLAWLPTDSRKEVKAALQKRADVLYTQAVKEAENGDTDD